jgi:hypothetical protein
MLFQDQLCGMTVKYVNSETQYKRTETSVIRFLKLVLEITLDNKLRNKDTCDEIKNTLEEIQHYQRNLL